jgi:hypothetical protein
LRRIELCKNGRAVGDLGQLDLAHLGDPGTKQDFAWLQLNLVATLARDDLVVETLVVETLARALIWRREDCNPAQLDLQRAPSLRIQTSYDEASVVLASL